MLRPEAAPLACRFCAAPLERPFLDLGPAPPPVPRDAGSQAVETLVRLAVYVCGRCWLVQLATGEGAAGEPPSGPPSDPADAAARAGAAVRRFGLGSESRVIEIASRDGARLAAFKALGVPVLGIAPGRGLAEVAAELGLPTVGEPFGAELAGRLAAGGTRADLLLAGPALAETRRLRAFVAGLAALLEPDGVVSLELLELGAILDGGRFDALHLGRLSYFSLGVAEAVLGAHGLELFDVEPGREEGVLHLAAARPGRFEVSPAVAAGRERDERRGYRSPAPYAAFARRLERERRRLLRRVLDAGDAGAEVVVFGADAEAATVAATLGLRPGLVAYAVDPDGRATGRSLAGSGLATAAPDRLAATRPGLVVVLGAAARRRAPEARRFAPEAEWLIPRAGEAGEGGAA